MKIGKITVSNSGKYAVPPHLINVVGVLSLFAVAEAVIIVFSIGIANSIYLDIPLSLITFLFYAWTTIRVLITACREPGLIPQFTNFTDVVLQIQMIFKDRNQANNNDVSDLYDILTHQIFDQLTLQINKLGRPYSFHTCNTCKNIKPLRSAHSARPNCCVMRFDHFCPWIGGDIGLNNHWLFYKMVTMITIFVIAATIALLTLVILAIIQLADCNSNSVSPICTQYSAGWSISALCVCFLFFCTGAYFVYSVFQLIAYHQNLLKSGSLTREYIGNFSQNFSITGSYSLLDFHKNYLEAKSNYKNKFTILQNYCMFQNNLLDLVQKDQNILNFVDLKQKMQEQVWFTADLQFYFEFESLIIYLEQTRSIQNYQLLWLKAQNNDKFQEMVEYFAELKNVIQGQVDDMIRERSVMRQRSMYLQIVQDTYTAYLKSIEQKVPYQTQQMIEQTPQYNGQILCATQLSTNFCAIAMSIQQIRTSQQQIDEFKKNYQVLFANQSEDVALDCCPKKTMKKQKNQIKPAVEQQQPIKVTQETQEAEDWIKQRAQSRSKRQNINSATPKHQIQIAIDLNQQQAVGFNKAISNMPSHHEVEEEIPEVSYEIEEAAMKENLELDDEDIIAPLKIEQTGKKKQAPIDLDDMVIVQQDAQIGQKDSIKTNSNIEIEQKDEKVVEKQQNSNQIEQDKQQVTNTDNAIIAEDLEKATEEKYDDK